MSAVSEENGWDDSGFVFFEREQRVRFLLSEGGQSNLIDDHYVQHRGDVIDWMIDAGEVLRLERNTVHNAVSCFDEFFARKGGVDRGVWQLLASACILVAAKCEETESASLILDKLHALNYGIFPKLAMVRMEQELLRTLEWDVIRTSAIQFIYYFLEISYISAGERMSLGLASIPPERGLFNSVDENSLDQTGHKTSRSSPGQVLLAESLRLAGLALRATNVSLFYRPSVVAAACITSAKLHLSPTCVLNQKLLQFLADSSDDVQPCAAAIDDLCRGQSMTAVKHDCLRSSHSPRSVMEIGQCLDGTVVDEEVLPGSNDKRWTPAALNMCSSNHICISDPQSKRQRLSLPPPCSVFDDGDTRLRSEHDFARETSTEIDVICSEQLDDSL
jgi:hypothetical protein